MRNVITTDRADMTVQEFERRLKNAHKGVFSDPPEGEAVASRLDRLLGKMLVPIYETSCRGVNQSSIWGCMAAAIWARESSKKAYWPALVLGILAPAEQREDWHMALTERNEQRLPEKLRIDLQSGKRKSQQALRKQASGSSEQMSYFLVEFMGTHEFIWVKESDIIEQFDLDDDPNRHFTPSGKKKRSSRSVSDSNTFATALDEAKWALEEFELQLSDTCGDLAEEEEDDEGQDMNYSYSVLCQSDEEADSAAVLWRKDFISESDVEEANELLGTDGLLDFSTEGRKNARKRVLARKKQKADAEKKDKLEQQKRARAEAKAESRKKAKAKASSASGSGKSGSNGKGSSGTSSSSSKRADTPKGSDKRKKRARDSSEKEKEKEKEKSQQPQRKKARTSTSTSTKTSAKTSTSTTTEKASAAAAATLPAAKLGTKRGRASTIVHGFITKLLETEDLKNLGISGVMNIPAATVDSSGILGMALAFKAAAGEIPMPETAEAYCRFRPWNEIDAKSPASSAERVAKLKEQLSLLETRAVALKKSTGKRKELKKAAVAKQTGIKRKVYEAEKKAKQKIMGRPSKKKSSSSASTPSSSSKESNSRRRASSSQVVPVAVASAEVVDANVVVAEAETIEADTVDVPEVSIVDPSGLLEAEPVEATVEIATIADADADADADVVVS